MATKEDINNIIQDSILRSNEYKTDILKYITNIEISNNKINILKRRNKKFLNNAIPFIESIETNIDNKDATFILCDKDANIIFTTNKNVNELIQTGLSLDETKVGTNTVAIAIEHDIALKLNEKEHYNSTFKEYSSCAAPIHSEKDEIIGCIAYFSHKNNDSQLHLPMVISTAKAIEDSIKHKELSRKLSSNTYYTFAIMNSLKFGVIAMNLDGELQYANDFACQILNTRRKELMLNNIASLIVNWQELHKQFIKTELILNEETTFINKKKREKFNLSIFPIYDKNSKLIGMVYSIREMHKVYGLINKYTGANARYTFDDIIAQSKTMKNIISFTKKVSNSPSTILLEGESGTGKEVMAQAIHNYSSRKDNGFVAINCAAIPETLMESELFGYDEGAFTGAKKGGQPGKFELANGGTLFLDEIGEMKPDMQVKLLRAIQESAIMRVGGDKVISIDVRIITATNKNLKQEVDEGNFRLDLFYRLNVIPIELPPLRERKEDIPPLIKHFLSKKSRLLKKSKPNIKFTTQQELLEYDWPGNIRELENHIEKLVNLNGEFPLVKAKDTKTSEEKTEKKLKKEETITFTLEEVEKKTIIKTLTLMNGNISKTAKALGIGRNTLYLKLRKYNIVL